MKKFFIPIVLALALLVPSYIYASEIEVDDYTYVAPSTTDYPPSIRYFYIPFNSDSWTFVTSLNGWGSSKSYNFRASTFSRDYIPNYYIEFEYYVEDGSFIPALSDFKFDTYFEFYGANVGSFDSSKVIKAEAWLLDGGENNISSLDVSLESDFSNKTVDIDLSGYSLTKSYGVRIRLFFNILDVTQVPLSNFSNVQNITVTNGDDVSFYYKYKNYFEDSGIENVPNLNIPDVDDSGMVDISTLIPDATNPLLIILALFTDISIIRILLIIIAVIGTVAYVLFGKR